MIMIVIRHAMHRTCISLLFSTLPVSYLYIMDGEMIIKYKHDFENVHILQRVDYQVNSAVVTVDSKYESHFKSSTLHSTDPFHLP